MQHARQLAPGGRGPLNILTVGASIVHGIGSSDGNGFRRGLQDNLVAAGFEVHMVGSQKAGTMPDNECDAWPGKRIDEVTANVMASLPTLQPVPNVILVHIGTNDIAQNYDTAGMGQRISGLVDYLCQTRPEAVVMVSTLLPHSDIDDAVRVYNDKIRAMVNEQSGRGRRVYLADIYIPELTPSDMADGVHPNDSGSVKLARIYAGRIQDALGQKCECRRAPVVRFAAMTSQPATTHPCTFSPMSFSLSHAFCTVSFRPFTDLIFNLMLLRSYRH